jgi:hypothetical protein
MNKPGTSFQEDPMTVQAQTKTIPASHIFEMLISTIFSRNETASYTASDFGFEIEGSELAEELSTPIPTYLQGQSAQINPSDFETEFNWFLS